MRRSLTLACTFVGFVCVGSACAQDFAAASPAGMAPAALRLLEDGWPAAQASSGAATLRTDWWAVPDLSTRALALHGAWRSLRSAIGVSQTGAPEIGWTTVAVACGAASAQAGAALRAGVRHDRTAPWRVAHLWATESALELGAGAWLCPARDVVVRVSAPQLVQHGGAPSSRALACELQYGRASAVWCALRAPRAGREGERLLGGALAIAPVRVWGELRDAPLRATTGVTFVLQRASCGVRVDEHPELGRTVRVSVAWSDAGVAP